MNVCECEIYVVIDQSGDYAVGNSADAAREKYEEDIGGLNECEGFRIVRMKVNVPLPEVVELTGTVPAQGAAKLSIVA